jgi:hypothetical protein
LGVFPRAKARGSLNAVHETDNVIAALTMVSAELGIVSALQAFEDFGWSWCFGLCGVRRRRASCGLSAKRSDAGDSRRSSASIATSPKKEWQRASR